MRIALTCAVALALIHALSSPVRAQSYYLLDTTIYIEVGGPGGEVSANFEKRTATHLALRLGVGGTPFSYARAFTVPATLSFLLGGRNNLIELGIGGSYVALASGWQEKDEDPWLDMTESQLVGVGVVGYRYQGDYGLFMRVAFTPVLTKDTVKGWGGVALGKSF